MIKTDPSLPDATADAPRQALAAVHVLNLHFLVTLRDAIRTEAARASYEYGIDVATAELLRHASDEDLRALSYGVDRALFTLRLRGVELVDVMQRPAPLRGVLITVRPGHPAPASGTDRRTLR
jgi:hypothetical protein